jgi:adenosyl cobinamide kinase/adenosyl cobinamide phosphate guanylyltransferase
MATASRDKGREGRGEADPGARRPAYPIRSEVREDVTTNHRRRIQLVLGGTRSGKSELAEQIAASLPQPVAYIATAAIAPGSDPDFEARIEAHRRRRPPSWETLEVGRDLVGALAATKGTVLVDSLGTWVGAHEDFDVSADELCEVLAARAADTVVVSEEVGLGVHPSSEAGRRFRDALGELNRRVAEVCDDVWLVVAGRCLRLEQGARGAAEAAMGEVRQC